MVCNSHWGLGAALGPQTRQAQVCSGPRSDAPARGSVFLKLEELASSSKPRHGPRLLSQQQTGVAYSCAGGGKAKKDAMSPLEPFKAPQVSQLCSQDAVLGPKLANCAWWGCFCMALALRIICMFLRVVLFKKEKKKRIDRKRRGRNSSEPAVWTLWPFTKRGLWLRLF